MRLYAYLIGMLALLLTGCQDTSDSCIPAPNVSDVPVSVRVVRMEEEMFARPSRAALRSLLEAHPVFAEEFLQLSQYPHDSIVINDLHRLVTDPRIDTLYQEVRNAYANISDLEAAFADAFRHVIHYYPDYQVPTIYTVVSGFGPDLFVSDSVVVVSLEYFLGEGGTYRPDLPDYMLSRFQRDYIVPAVMTVLSDRFNQTQLTDKTLLAEMIYYGKAYHFTKQVMPCVPDSVILGYSPKQLADVRAHENIIWSHLVDRQKLFETSHFEVNRYVGERPTVLEIGPRCPGRVGRWVGWNIVQAYRTRTDKSLPDVMAQKNAQQLFQESRYKPEA